MNKSGFTLVELSIVLVIIGLLVGGVLVGKSLIDSAEIVKFTNQIQQYQIAEQSFYVKYNSLPGDTRFFSPAGDGDKYVYDAATTLIAFTHVSYQFAGEVANYWKHIAEGGFAYKNIRSFNIDATSGIVPDVHVPAFNKEGGIFTLTPVVGSANRQGFYFITGLQNSANNSIPRTGDKGIVLVSTYLGMDKKMDDGIANSGNMIGTYKKTTTPSPPPDGGLAPLPTTSYESCTFSTSPASTDKCSITFFKDRY